MDDSVSGYRQLPADLDLALAGLGSPSPPEPRVRGLALAAAATALGRRDLLRGVLRGVLAAGIPPEPLREALLQTYLFTGYPRAINALAELAALAPVPEPRPLGLELSPAEAAGWTRSGETLCRRIYGPRYDKLREVMGRISPDLGRWMILEGYGKVLSRPALGSRDRELIAVAALVPLDVPDQLRAHLRGAWNVGASDAEILGTLEVAASLLPDALDPARAVYTQARAEVEADRS
jgi:4-carboxymuconolactone decarboxylase